MKAHRAHELAFPSQMHTLNRYSLLFVGFREKGVFAGDAERREHLQGVFAVQAAGDHKLCLSEVWAEGLYAMCYR